MLHWSRTAFMYSIFDLMCKLLVNYTSYSDTCAVNVVQNFLFFEALHVFMPDMITVKKLSLSFFELLASICISPAGIISCISRGGLHAALEIILLFSESLDAAAEEVGNLEWGQSFFLLPECIESSLNVVSACCNFQSHSIKPANDLILLDRFQLVAVCSRILSERIKGDKVFTAAVKVLRAVSENKANMPESIYCARLLNAIESTLLRSHELNILTMASLVKLVFNIGSSLELPLRSLSLVLAIRTSLFLVLKHHSSLQSETRDAIWAITQAKLRFERNVTCTLKADNALEGSLSATEAFELTEIGLDIKALRTESNFEKRCSSEEENSFESKDISCEAMCPQSKNVVKKPVSLTVFPHGTSLNCHGKSKFSGRDRHPRTRKAADSKRAGAGVSSREILAIDTKILPELRLTRPHIAPKTINAR